MTSLAPAEMYFSGDVETDGPIPGPFSMLSMGLVSVATFDGSTLNRVSTPEIFYAELKPISPNFEPEALAINGLDRESLLNAGDDPNEAMTRAAEWVQSVAGPYTPVFVGYPAPFDWMWLTWYFLRFSTGGSPFGHANCFDIKTLIAVDQGVMLSEAKPRTLPPTLQNDEAHTHQAAEDALRQGEIFIRILTARRDQSLRADK